MTPSASAIRRSLPEGAGGGGFGPHGPESSPPFLYRNDPSLILCRCGAIADVRIDFSDDLADSWCGQCAFNRLGTWPAEHFLGAWA